MLRNEAYHLEKKILKKILEKNAIAVAERFSEEKINVKYFWVKLDQFLTFQNEVKLILRKIACVIKTLHSI